MKNWCVYSIDKDTSMEIKERAEVNGLDVSNIEGDGKDIYYSCRDGIVYVGFSSRVAIVTIDELRKMLPLPHEKPIVWDGEGKPPVGIVCKKCFNSPDVYYKVKIHAHDGDFVICEWLEGVNGGCIEKEDAYVYTSPFKHNNFIPVDAKPVTLRNHYIMEMTKLFVEAGGGEINDAAFGALYDKFLGNKK